MVLYLMNYGVCGYSSSTSCQKFGVYSSNIADQQCGVIIGVAQLIHNVYLVDQCIGCKIWCGYSSSTADHQCEIQLLV